MAFRAFLITMIIVVAAAPAFANDYTVGDDAGWTLDVDYSKWTQGKGFHVGDKLKFMYIPGFHNVLKVNGTDFKQCSSSNVTNIPLTSGNDTITLATPGKKWYICGIDNHCSKGMKLVITVSSTEAPAPASMPVSPAATPQSTPMPASFAPTPGNSAAGEFSPLRSCVWMLPLIWLSIG